MKERKILIIEDDPDHADLMLDIFDTEDIESEVVLMQNGQEVIDYLQKTYSSDLAVQSDINGGNGRHSHIDLIILDLNLPKISGMDVLKALKKNPRYCSIPVVILSTNSDENTILEAYKNGANGYVTKPMSYDEFVDKIKLLRKYWSDTNTLPLQI
ncbi:MAG: response regulator [Candidatus Scalindua sp.]